MARSSSDEGAVLHADQAVHHAAEMVHQLADLAVLALGEHAAVPAVGASALAIFLDELGTAIADAIDGDALRAMPAMSLGRQRAAHAHAVDARQRRLGAHHRLRQRPVGGQQQQAFAVHVEPADIHHARIGGGPQRRVQRGEIEDRLAALVVAVGHQHVHRAC